MKIDIVTIFPDMFNDFLSTSIVSRAIKAEALSVEFTNIRDYATDTYRHVDDYPYGGGAGMVLKPEPLGAAIESLDYADVPIVYFTPQGRLLNQSVVHEYSLKEKIIILCGHYKEIDQRIRDKYVTDEISLGDYVISGGELAAMVMIDALARLQDGVINDIHSALTDSHQDGLLGCPHYTRPASWNNMDVPEVLLSGNHRLIEKWRAQKAFETTQKIRPDLLKYEK